MNKKIEVIMFCPRCKKTPPRDEKQSNENWNVIPAKCPECNLHLKLDVIAKMKDEKNQKKYKCNKCKDKIGAVICSCEVFRTGDQIINDEMYD